MIYKIKKFQKSPPGNGDWEKFLWRDMQYQHLQHFMGEKPAHFPQTTVKVGYNDMFIFVMFMVKDQFVRAVAQEHHDPVYKDSCVEFFFTPGPDSSRCYFNLEMNCGGFMLFDYHPECRKEGIVIPTNECDKIIKSHSMPPSVEPEISDPVTWTVEYWIPINLLSNYCDVVKPESGAVWRANFYKCADDCSHPHWLTWAPVIFPEPNFHLPQYFGKLEFE